MFRRSAPYYDLLYGKKDYRGESRRLEALIRRHARSGGNALLDVACGTGGHIAHLRRRFDVTGVDLEPRLLAIARRKHPGVRFYRGDMRRFALRRRFDVVTCLFSAIGYMRTPAQLQAAVANMARHLRPGGLLILEPWLSPRGFTDRYSTGEFVKDRDVAVARFAFSRKRRRQSVMRFSFLVARPGRIERFEERHRLGLFTLAEYAAAVRRAGLRPLIHRRGLTGRGLVLGLAPLREGARR